MGTVIVIVKKAAAAAATAMIKRRVKKETERMMKMKREINTKMNGTPELTLKDGARCKVSCDHK